LGRKAAMLMGLGLVCGFLAAAQKPAGKAPSPAAPAASELADEMAQRFSKGLGVKTAVGEAIHLRGVTLFPILMVDVNFAGAGVAGPTPGASGADGFLMSGEVRPLGFVAVTKTKTWFVSAGSAAGQ